MTEPAARLRVALAQVDPTVGDIDGNVELIAGRIARARDEGADLVVFPEQCIPGYPAEDLYLKPHFAAANHAALERLAPLARGIAVLVGFAERADVAATGPPLPRSTTRSPCSPRAGCARFTARTCCPTTASSTRSATSFPEPSPRRSRSRASGWG